MNKYVAMAVAMSLMGCGETDSGDNSVRIRTSPKPPVADPAPTPPVSLEGAVRAEVWATRYFAAELEHDPHGVHLRDMRGHPLGPRLRREDWCTAAMEGTVIVDGVVYNWAGTTGYSQADCDWDGSETVRFSRVDAPYGLGVENRSLQPFRSLACDIGRAQGTEPFLEGRAAHVGQEVYIPDAVGTRLPDGTTHDGMFVCEDMGEMITGNHIDVFIGPVPGGDAVAAGMDPFSFIHSTPDATFEAYFLP